MAILKYYDGDSWEPVASALVGPTGATGAAGVTGATGPNPGLTLIKTETFSAVSSVNVNDVFSSTYTNYAIIFNGLTSGGSSIWLRLRVSGTDATGSDYTYQGLRGVSSTAEAFTGTSTGFLMTSNAAASNQFFVATIFKPNVAENTYMITNSVQNVPATAQMGNYHTLSTAYTGFTLIPITTGTTTGTVSVYGYNK
jgi:hypothetical protein